MSTATTSRADLIAGRNIVLNRLATEPAADEQAIQDARAEAQIATEAATLAHEALDAAIVASNAHHRDREQTRDFYEAELRKSAHRAIAPFLEELRGALKAEGLRHVTAGNAANHEARLAALGAAIEAAVELYYAPADADVPAAVAELAASIPGLGA